MKEELRIYIVCEISIIQRKWSVEFYSFKLIDFSLEQIQNYTYINLLLIIKLYTEWLRYIASIISYDLG